MISSIDEAASIARSDVGPDALYPARALELILQLQGAEGPPQLLDALVSATEAIGAAASLYSVAIPGTENEGEPFNFSLFACDPAFAHRQQQRGPLPDHPWFRFARTHSSPGTDRTVLAEGPADQEALALARQHGFASCLIVPTPAGPDLHRVEMLCLGSRRHAAFEGEDARIVRALARSLAAELHDWVTRHLSLSLKEAARLQQIDITLLHLEWQGLGTKAISARTGLSPSAVDTRFQRLNYRLDCPNRKASARRAAEHGLLESRN
jgi:hypothetical protein